MNGFAWPVRVYYEDTDAGGVVYYANYLRFLERARTEWLRSLGFEQDALARDAGVIFAVRRVEVDYLKPARFNDALTVHARIAERGRASLVFAQEVRRGDEVLVKGMVKVACLEAASFRPAPIPAAIVEVMPHAD
ncbi:MAG: tol-pal system-associated acyl-CoA thioesterase [Gammaproteobacteria bacterium]|jgi:acyl-CoA thioester hydrolase|nr:tol-pal system-associated acyl-CoA thioesterase [Gammaproteobacteria bacterium]